MGAADKASNKIDNAGGKAKEALGKVTGDKDTENKGKVDQAKPALRTPAKRSKTHSRTRTRTCSFFRPVTCFSGGGPNFSAKAHPK